MSTDPGWAERLSEQGRVFAREEDNGWLDADGAQLRLTDGRPAALLAVRERNPNIGLFDLALAAADWRPQRIDDAAGLIVARTLAMLINAAQSWRTKRETA